MKVGGRVSAGGGGGGAPRRSGRPGDFQLGFAKSAAFTPRLSKKQITVLDWSFMAEIRVPAGHT